MRRAARRPRRTALAKSSRRVSRVDAGSTEGSGRDGQADNWLRPLRRRAAMITRPARVRIRNRKPWVLARRRLFGWKVRLPLVTAVVLPVSSSFAAVGTAKTSSVPGPHRHRPRAVPHGAPTPVGIGGREHARIPAGGRETEPRVGRGGGPVKTGLFRCFPVSATPRAPRCLLSPGSCGSGEGLLACPLRGSGTPVGRGDRLRWPVRRAPGGFADPAYCHAQLWITLWTPQRPRCPPPAGGESVGVGAAD